ncbi:uncharacterized protein EV420DRAFT_1584837 [Desarmillaria tabescens]|uniref:JmjC domain-containing protein n=1 Tax=Armillaria tabescens TaxID=1929756 RepID=A0AA39JBR2_ARMTA|nr:uncharacterized protein EV420DRAFT_1584837 [Desarmillaria tabescens]KAK0439092.1 hypothetical protein EV420DRAFT_1584837 [Desarmillaria tabescens]
MLQEARRGDLGQVLNALEFPLGGTVLKSVPKIESIASDVSAFDKTKNLMDRLAGEQEIGQMTPFPHQAMSWGLCGLKSSTTHPHRDSHGLPTHVSQLTGGKAWSVMQHSDPRKDNCNLYIDYIKMHFEVDEEILPFFRAETVYLDNTTQFIMKPNAYHYVVTLEHSITYGGHFIAMQNIRNTLIGYVHTAMLTYSITNTLHPEVKRLLFRIMINWGWHGTDFDTVSSDPHIPDWSTREGLLNVIALGNVILFAEALEPPNVLNSDPVAMLEWLTARDTYVYGIAAFQHSFEIPENSNIFLESAKRFGVSILDYLNHIEHHKKQDPTAAAAHREHVEGVLERALQFENAKNTLKWSVKKGYFRDATYVEDEENKRTLFWEPVFTIKRRS